MIQRREFLKVGAVAPAAAALSGLPGWALGAVSPHWRVFEITANVEVLKPSGTSRVWLPVPLIVDTDYQKALGNTWSTQGGKVAFTQRPQYDMGIVDAEFPASEKAPKLTLVSRFATRDRSVDLSGPGRAMREDPAVLDLNFDGFADVAYFVDLGGQVNQL